MGYASRVKRQKKYSLTGTEQCRESCEAPGEGGKAMRVYRVLMCNSDSDMESCVYTGDWQSCLCFSNVTEGELATFLKLAEDYNKFIAIIPESIEEKEEDKEEN